MENKEQLIQEFIKEYEGLTTEQKKAICWLIENNEIADELSKGEKIPKDEMESLINRAIQKDDYIMLVLLIYKNQIDENNNT